MISSKGILFSSLAISQSILIIYPSSLRQQARGERDRWLGSFIEYRAQRGEREAVLEADAVRVYIAVYIGDKCPFKQNGRLRIKELG